MRTAARGTGTPGGPLRHPVPQRPLRHENAEKDRAAAGDRRVRASMTAAEPGECEEERKHDETEARQRQEWPPRARNAQREREAQRREEPVRCAELPPCDHGEHDKEREEGEELEVEH